MQNSIDMMISPTPDTANAATISPSINGAIILEDGAEASIVGKIYEKFDYPAMVLSLPNGEQRLANIRLLSDTAAEYEAQGIFGIHDFVKHIEKITKKNGIIIPVLLYYESNAINEFCLRIYLTRELA